MRTPGRRGFDGLVIGSSTNRAMRKVSSPVLVVSNQAHNVMTPGPGGKPRLSRIVYCTDFSIHSGRALQYTISLAADCSAELTMFHVVEGAPDLTATEVIIAARTEQLDKLISDDQRKHLNVRTAARCSKPYEEIVGYAEEVQAHLMVMTAPAAMLWTMPFSARRHRVVQLGPGPGDPHVIDSKGKWDFNDQHHYH
jgi:nucleotide-binding universal stress UspA family protein